MRRSMAVALSLSLAPLLASLTVSSLAQTQTVDTPIGNLDFELGVPTKETVTKLYDAMDFQRASQLYLWGCHIDKPVARGGQLANRKNYVALQQVRQVVSGGSRFPGGSKPLRPLRPVKY